MWARASISFLSQRTFSVSARNGSPLTVFWGSQTGTAKGFAEQLHGALSDQGINNQLVDLKTFKAEKHMTKGTDAIFVAACYGMGEPTDNATQFYKWLMAPEREKENLQGVRFSVFGLGSSKTHKERFNVIGKNIDKRLEELGAHRMMDRVDGDDSDCIEVQFDEFQSQFCELYPKIKDQSPPASSSGFSTKKAESKSEQKSSQEPAPPPPPCPPEITNPKPQLVIESGYAVSPSTSVKDRVPFYFSHLKAHPNYVPETTLRPVTANFNVTPESTRPTFEMHVDCKELPWAPSVSYTTGDHVAIYGENSPETVNWFIRRLGYEKLNETKGGLVFRKQGGQGVSNGTEMFPPYSVPLNAAPLSVEQILTHLVELRFHLTPKLLRTIADLAKDPADKERLLAWSAPAAFKTEVFRNRFLADLLEECPSVNIDFDLLMSILPTSRPRYYSISSSSKMHPSVMHVTYRVFDFMTPKGTLQHGTCSNYLAKRASPDHVLVSVRPSTFRLPPPQVPIIMVAGGVGITPFKAFMEERLAEANTNHGEAYLFYGSRDIPELAYKDLVDEAAKKGKLTKCFYSFSHNPPQGDSKRFISEDLLANATLMYSLLQRGAYVYVCGGSTGFGPSIVNAFKSIIQKQGCLPCGDMENYFGDLMKTGRYLEDLSD